MDTYDPIFLFRSAIFRLISNSIKLLPYKFSMLWKNWPVGTYVAVTEAKQIQDQFLKGEHKMKKLSMVFLAVLIATALASTTLVYGWGGGWGRGHARGACAGGPGDEGNIQSIPELGLTAEQTAKIKDLREAHLKDIKPLRDKMFSKRGELKLLWLQTTPDREKITAVQKEIGSLRDQMQDKGTSQRLAMLNILTPEQRTRVQALGAEKGFGPGGGRGFGPCDGNGPRSGPGGGPRGNR
jgi:Spy/CpxP family protein refolding chaperone